MGHLSAKTGVQRLYRPRRAIENAFPEMIRRYFEFIVIFLLTIIERPRVERVRCAGGWKGYACRPRESRRARCTKKDGLVSVGFSLILDTREVYSALVCRARNSRAT